MPLLYGVTAMIRTRALRALVVVIGPLTACADRTPPASAGAIVSDGSIELQGEITLVELTADDRRGWWVIDKNTRQLILFDSTGVKRDSVGREGDGPGELREPYAVAHLAGDRLVVIDGREHRMTVFDLSREPRLVAAYKAPELFSTLLQARAYDHVLGLAIPFLPYTTEGPKLYTVDITTGEPVDTVDIWQRAPDLLPAGSERPRFIGASRAGDGIALTLRNPFRVAVLHDSGGVTLWPNAVTPKTARDWNQHEIDSMVANIRMTLPPDVPLDSAKAVAFAKSQKRPDLLHLRAFAGAPDGSTWALRLQETGVALARFSADGIQTGSHPLSRKPMLLRSTDDGVATVTETESGAIVIERFRYEGAARP